MIEGFVKLMHITQRSIIDERDVIRGFVAEESGSGGAERNILISDRLHK